MSDPLGSSHGALGQAAAVLDLMANFDSVSIADGRDNMFSLGVAHAVGGNEDLCRRTCPGSGGLDDLAQRDGGAGGRVELRDVMSLVNGEFVSVKLGQRGGEPEKLLHPNGKVGAIEQRSAVLARQGLHLVQPLVPACCAHDNAAAESENGAHVLDGCVRGGEVDHRVDTG